MRALYLDYLDKHRNADWQDALILIAGLAFTGYIAVTSVDLYSRITALDGLPAEHSQSKAASSATHRASADTQKLRDEVKQANSVLGMLTLPWDDLFNDIEASTKDRVALLSITPDPEKRLIRITAEAKDFDAMIAYIRLLQSRSSFADVYLTSHHVEQRMPETPVRFSLTASWVLKS